MPQNNFHLIPVEIFYAWKCVTLSLSFSDESQTFCGWQRVGEIRKVVDVLEMLEGGLLTQESNAVRGRAKLNVKMMQSHIDMCHIAIRGHSFGGSTAIVACGLDKRIKCCVAEDTWWQPIEQV